MTQYKLAGRIESGELADLYRGTRDGVEPIVLKLFHPRTTDPAYARELATTMRLLGSVRHPGVVHVHEIGLIQQRLGVVQDDAGKVSLGQALTRLNTKEVLLAPGLAVALVLELLDAVAHAHNAGVLHGALTPGNVLLSAEGRPAICDFGALKALFASKALAKQFGGRGRTSYRAPEMTKGDELSVESDLYSVAAIAYELLTLKEASTGSGPNVSTRRGAVPPPSRIDRRLNPRLDPVILRALDMSPSRRYRSAQDFAAALRDFLAANGGLPSRDEQKRFVTTLFPVEVTVGQLGPPLFTEAFTLDEVTGAELAVLEERSVVVPARSPFSGGEIDHAAATQEAMPALEEFKPGAATLPEMPIEPPPAKPKIPLTESGQFPSWDAPVSSDPVKKAGQAESDSGTRALEKRVRVIEDFQALEKGKGPGKPQNLDSGPVPVGPRERLVLPTSEMPLVPGPPVRESWRPPPSAPSKPGPDRDLLKEQRRQRWKLGVYALIAIAGGAGGFYYLATTSSGRVMPAWRPIPQAPTIKAPPFRPDLRPPPDKDPKEPKDPRPVVKDRNGNPTPKEPCYDPPNNKKKAAYVTITATRRMVVRIDGVKLCGGDFTRIALEPGKRRITVAEGAKDSTPFEATQRFEAGKEVHLVPVFHSRGAKTP